MGEVWGSTINHPTSESASIVSNKGMNGVNQKVAPGLSATIHMKLKRKHSGVKMGGFHIPIDCCGYYIACTIGSPSKCPSHCKTYNFNINCSR